MKYCKKITQTHPLSIDCPICLEDINILISEESNSDISPLFINNEVVINLDKAEEIIADTVGRDRNKSMDLAFGIANDNEDSTFNEMQMVELKLNYVNNLRNLKVDDLKEKIKDSKKILTEKVPISNNYIFIFKTNHIEEAKNKFFRAGFARNFIVMDIHNLQAIYF